MNVAELYRRLSVGTLSNLTLGNKGDGTIREANKPGILVHANDGLSALYSKFVLKQSRLLLQASSHRDLYPLRREHAVSSIAEDNPAAAFILDSTAEPFLGDVVSVLSVADQFGRSYIVNSESDLWGLETPEPDVLRVPFASQDQIMSVVYQARHVELTGDQSQEIDLPVFLERALTHYVAAEVYGNMNTQEASFVADRNRLKYEEVCNQVEMKNLASTSHTSSKFKFDERGFV